MGEPEVDYVGDALGKPCPHTAIQYLCTLMARIKNTRIYRAIANPCPDLWSGLCGSRKMVMRIRHGMLSTTRAFSTRIEGGHAQCVARNACDTTSAEGLS